MSELIKIAKSEFSILNGKDAGLAEAIQAQLDAGVTLSARDLIRVKTPSGGTTKWSIGDRLVPEIVGAFVGYQRCSILWPTDQSEEGQMPCLRSLDGMTAEQVGPVPPEMLKEMAPYLLEERVDDEGMVIGRKYQISPESGFPYTQWGSGKEGRGKKMKDQRVVFILPPEDPAPLYVMIQPFSLATFDKWFSQIVQLYRVPWYRLVIGLSLTAKTNKAKQLVSVVTPRYVRTMDEDEARALKAIWGDSLKMVAQEASVGPQED